MADRLRALTAARVVERRLDLDSNGVVYALTPWGEQLRGAVDALVRWSTPLMIPGRGADRFQPQWLLVALLALLRDRTSKSPATIGLETADVTITVRLDGDGPHVSLDPGAVPATVLRADPEVVLGLAAGALTVDQAIAAGTVSGDPENLVAVFG